MKKLGDLIKGGITGTNSLEVLCEGEDASWTKSLLEADRAYDKNKRYADRKVNIDPVIAAYKYAKAANYAGAGFKILIEQEDAPLDEKLDRGKKWWEAHKLAADTAPATEKKHAAYNRALEGKAAAAIFKFIDPLPEVSEKEKILWAERWYLGCKEGADMLIRVDNETAWGAYWSAKNAAEVLLERKKSLSIRNEIYNIWALLMEISDSNERFDTTRMGARFVASDLYERTGRSSWRKKVEMLDKMFEPPYLKTKKTNEQPNY